MFLVAFALFSVLFYGGRACKLTGQPNDVVAEVGTNAILTCPTDIDNNGCNNNMCKVNWHRLTKGKFRPITSCGIVGTDFVKRFSISDGPNWSLNITGVKLDDTRKYRCKITRSAATLKVPVITSENVTLIVPSGINITVRANPFQITEGENVVFNCLARRAKGAHLTYKWFLYGTDITAFSIFLDFSFGKDKQTLEIRSVGIAQDRASIFCAAYSGDIIVKTSEQFTLRVRGHPMSTQPIVPEISTINPDLITTNQYYVISGPSTEDHRPRAPAVTVEGGSQPHTPSIQTKQEPDPGIDHSGNGNSVHFVGVGVAAVFLILDIVCIVYCIVLRGRNKTLFQRPNSRDGDRRDAGTVELTATHLSKRAASESAKASTSCTRDKEAVEPRPLDSQTQVQVHSDQNSDDMHHYAEVV